MERIGGVSGNAVGRAKLPAARRPAVARSWSERLAELGQHSCVSSDNRVAFRAVLALTHFKSSLSDRS